MELPASPSSHQFNVRKTGEPGLAEWAQKIRTLQRQVDEDEEEEHRRLEQEIAASRLARVRRSAAYGRSSFDPAAVPLDIPSPTSRRFDVPESANSSTVRRVEQTEPLQKPIRKPSPRPQTAPSSPASKSHATSIESRNIKTSSVPQPVFGQGSMAMPDTSRRRVASPTQDHDSYSPMPTASTRIHSPLAKHEFNREPTPIMNNDHRSGVDASRQPLTSTSSAALKRYMERVEQVTSTQSSKTTFERDVPRPRTISTPSGTHPTHATARPSPSLASPRARIPPRTPNFDAHRTPPAFDSDFPLSKSPSHPSSKSSTTAFITPTKSATPSASSPIFGVKLSTFSTSIPESSKPKVTPLTPQHRTPSLHPPKEKDPTPSISRLKGRGFVQSMVKASSALEAAATNPTKPEVGKFSPSKRSSSVASRWKSESPLPSSSRPAATPIPTNFRKSWTPSAASASSIQKTVAQRKSWTTSEPLKIEESERERPVRALDQQNTNRSVRLVESHHTGRSGHAVEHQQTGQSTRVPGAEYTERSIHKAPSLPSLSAHSRPSTPPPASPGGHGIGSSSTMFSYIKPTKTGDDHATGHPPPHSRPTTPKHVSAGGMASAQDADELGHRTGVGLSGQRDGVTGFPAPSGRPLVHLTKGRPKPKRANRKNMGERLSETRTTSTSTLSSSPRVPTHGPPVKSAIAQAATPTPTPSQSPITSPPPHAVGATSHTDIPTQRRSHQPTSQTDRSSANTTDQWNEQTSTSVRSSNPARPTTPNLQDKPFLVGIARPLPGLSTPSSSPTKPPQTRPPSASPRSPRRQGRIPSTGSRTLVMDVVQAFQEAQTETTEAEVTTHNPIPYVMPRQVELPALPIEKQKSGFDKYLGHVIPSLPEDDLSTRQDLKSELNMQKEVAVNSDVRGQEQTHPDNLLPVQQDTRFIEIPYNDEPLPRVDLNELLLSPSVCQPTTDFTTISVDVMSVTGAAATSLKNDTDVFYDSEILAIVRRIKLKSSGLVETTLWGWQGRRSQIGEREQRKLKDMARHYGTKLFPVQQGCEPPDLVHALGGRLVTRQGTRSYWSAENTTMHQVRLVHGNVFIDELEFNVSNLCSAFSYCLTLLGTCYVWHGKGSLPGERQAALGYALSFAVESSPVELVEQESDDNEMFWMMLGNDDYARADYWKWRPDLETALPQIWRVDSSSAPYLTTVQTFTTQSNVDLSVFLLDCIWELFVIVGTKARTARRDIRLALSTARDLSSLNAVRRPFTPPIHVLILPSKIPLDLRLHFRDLDEERLNGTYQPDHMNLLELSEALSDLERVRWEKSRLNDLTMLPLGIDPTCLPQSLTVDRTPFPVPR